MRTILTAVLLCGALAVPAFTARPEASNAQPQGNASNPHPSPRRPPDWWKTPKYMQELKLTAEQSAELERIIMAGRAQLTADKEDLDRSESDFRQLMSQPNVPKRELLKAAERLEMARYSIARERTLMTVRIHSVLTPEQRQGLSAIAKREAERNRQHQK